MMKKIIFGTIGIVVVTLFTSNFVFAQGMMGFSSSSPDNATIQSQQQEEQEGKKFLDNLNNKIVTCSQLKDADFEKIGEYFMGQATGDTSRHITMNDMMKSMMGEQGEEQMHTAWGKRGSGCDTNTSLPSNMMGGMMETMMDSGSKKMSWMRGYGLLFDIYSIIFPVLLFIVLILLAIWLWKQIKKK